MQQAEGEDGWGGPNPETLNLVWGEQAQSGGCPPVYNEKDASTFDKKTKKPKRDPDFCKHARGSAADTTQHYTMVFNVFVLMQVHTI